MKAAEKRGGNLFSQLNKAEEAVGEDMEKLAKVLDSFALPFQSAMEEHAVDLEQYMRHLDYLVELVGPNSLPLALILTASPTSPEMSTIAAFSAKSEPVSSIEA